MKLLSVDPSNYSDAPREGIRRILQEVIYNFAFAHTQKDHQKDNSER